MAVNKTNEVLSQVQGLKRGDRVLVLWHDACRVNNDPDVRPEYYSTPKETQGTVYDCLPDPNFPDVFYLIISGETTAGKPDYYDAIPLAWIARIQKLELAAKITVKTPMKEAKDDQYDVRRVIVFKNGTPQTDSGGISKMPMKWGGPGSTHKMVERIVKVIA
jgi:hypothetical protein